MSVLRSSDLAEPLAEEAHTVLEVAESALRLAQVRLALGKVESAAELLAYALQNATEERTATIARTQLTQAAARQVERLRKADSPTDALVLGTTYLAAALASIEQGIADALLRPNALELITEMAQALVLVPTLSDQSEALNSVLGAAPGLISATPTFGRKDELDRALADLVIRDDLPQSAARLIGEIRASLFAAAQPLEGGRRRGLVHRFFVGKGGLIMSGGDEAYVPFGKDALTTETAALLVPGASISYSAASEAGSEHGTALRYEGAAEEREAVLRKRRGTVIKTTYDYAFAVDKLTGVFVFVHRNHFPEPTEWELLERGDEVDYDLELSNDGRWRAARRSARLARGG